MNITVYYDIMTINKKGEHKRYKSFPMKEFDKAVEEYHSYKKVDSDAWFEKKTYFPTGRIDTEKVTEENIQNITQAETSIRTVLGVIILIASVGAVCAFGFLGVIGLVVAAIVLS